MTRLTITRRTTDRGQRIYAAFDANEPQDADTLARLLKNRTYDTATVEADFSPAGSAQLNVPCRSEVEAERDKLRGLLENAKAIITLVYETAEDARHGDDVQRYSALDDICKAAASLLARIDAALLSGQPTAQVVTLPPKRPTPEQPLNVPKFLKSFGNDQGGAA